MPFGLICFSHATIRLLLGARFFRSPYLFCADAGQYYGQVMGSSSSRGRLMGYPLLLRLMPGSWLLPDRIIWIQAGFTVLAHWIFLNAIGGLKPTRTGRLKLVASLVIFLEPHFTRIDSMAYMPDSLCLLGVVIACHFACQYFDHPWAPNLSRSIQDPFPFRLFMLSIVLGLLTVLKTIFLPWVFLLVALWGMAQITSLKRLRPQVIGLLVLMPILVQMLYSITFTYSQSKSLKPDSFGTLLALNRTLHFSTCAESKSAAQPGPEQTAIQLRCIDSELAGERPLWYPGGVLSRVAEELSPYASNGKYMNNGPELVWLARLVSRRPTLIIRSLFENLHFFLSGDTGSLNFGDYYFIDPSCGRIITDFKLSPTLEEDRTRYDQWYASNLKSLQLLDWKLRPWFRLVSWGCMIALVGLPWYLLRRRWAQSFLLGSAWIYLWLVSFANPYEPRYLFILVVMAAMAVLRNAPEKSIQTESGLCSTDGSLSP